MKISRAAILAICAILASLLPVARASAAEPAWIATEVVILGVPGPAPLTGAHACTGAGGTCKIYATVYTPNPAPANPVPALLMQHGFPGNRQVPYVQEAAKFYASQGYVAFTWDARGFGQSEGYVELDSPDYEGADVDRIVAYLAARADVQQDAPGDPRVGFYGQSYGGGLQFTAPAVRNGIVDVRVARETWNDLNSALFPNGIIKYQWVSLLFLGGEQSTNGNLDPQLGQWLAEAYSSNNASASLKAELRKRSAVGYPAANIPTFFMQGEHDTLFNMIEQQRNLQAVAATGAPVKLFWYWGGHGSYTEYPNSKRTWVPTDIMESRQLTWLNHYLKNDGSDTGPAFEYFDSDKQLKTAPGLPPVATRSITFQPPATPAVKPAGRACPQTGAPSCSFSEVSNFTAPGQPFANEPPFDAPGTTATFESDNFTSNFGVVGVPQVTFTAKSASGQPVSLFWKVFDVDGSGSATLINRLVTPIRATSGTATTLDLAGFANLFAPGHHLRLVAATTDAAYFGTDLADVVTFAGPVTLSLPVTSEAVVAAPGPRPAAVQGVAQGPELPRTGGGATQGGLIVLVLATLLFASGRRRRLAA